MDYERSLLTTLTSRLTEPRKFIQVIAGPRQVGKTTLAIQLRDQWKGLAAYHSADDVQSGGDIWIDQLWESLRVHMRLEQANEALLILDEIQKINDWSAAIKKNWDKDAREKTKIKLVLLGSSRLLLMDGLSESLTGRYELIYAGHWSFAEMKEAFGYSAEEYIWFGGYPGTAAFAGDEPRFKEYIRNSIVEPTMVRDILMTAKIDKPALLRQLFDIGSAYSAQIVSYTKMLGQLQNAGNTTTLARYLKLLEQAGLLSGLNKYSGSPIQIKGTIPKFQIHNTALLSAMQVKSFEEALVDPGNWGNIFESSVGTHLLDLTLRHAEADLYYWREKNCEIDYVLVFGDRILGIEVKSTGDMLSAKNKDAFRRHYPSAALLLVGENGLPYESFMQADLSDLFRSV